MATADGKVELDEAHEASVFVENDDTDAVYFHVESNSSVGVSFSWGGHVDLEAAEKLVTLLQQGITAVRANRQRDGIGMPVPCNRALVGGGRCAKLLHHDDDIHRPGSNPPDVIAINGG